MRNCKPCVVGFMIFSLSGGVAWSETGANQPSWLFVQTASELHFDGNLLTIPYEREIFGFTDRPNRIHTYMNAHEFEMFWNFGEGDFSEDPPNAVLTWLADNETHEAEITLETMSVDELGNNISYGFTLEVGDQLPLNGSYVSLFIDDFDPCLPARVQAATANEMLVTMFMIGNPDLEVAVVPAVTANIQNGFNHLIGLCD